MASEGNFVELVLLASDTHAFLLPVPCLSRPGVRGMGTARRRSCHAKVLKSILLLDESRPNLPDLKVRRGEEFQLRKVAGLPGIP